MRKRIKRSLKEAQDELKDDVLSEFDKQIIDDTCEMGIKQSVYDSLLDVRQTITGFIIAFKLKEGFENKNIRVIKSVYIPSSDVYQIYINSHELCLYIEQRINAYNRIQKYFESVYVDCITEECTALEIRINDPKRIKLGKEHKLSIISI